MTLARRRLREIGAGYVEFALVESGLFRLVFTAYPDPPEGKAAGSAESVGTTPTACSTPRSTTWSRSATSTRAYASGRTSRDGRPSTASTCSTSRTAAQPAAVGAGGRLAGLLLGIDRGLGVGGDWPVLTAPSRWAEGRYSSVCSTRSPTPR